MPHYNIWVREDDDAKWQAVGNRSEFLHNALNGRDIAPLRPLTQGDVHAIAQDLGKRVQEDYHKVEAEKFVPKPPDPELGYPCCTKAKPCKHWAFDGAEGVWRNEVTGKTREVV